MPSPRYDRLHEITARFNSQNCINGQHQIRQGDKIGYARRGRQSFVCCTDCWRQWEAENAAADFDEMRYASQY